MSAENLDSQIYKLADDMLMSSQAPDAHEIASQLGFDVTSVDQVLSSWWSSLPERVVVLNDHQKIPGLPDSLTRSFMGLWQQALQEARSEVSLVRQRKHIGEEFEKQVNDDALHKSQRIQHDLEVRIRDQAAKNEEKDEHIRALEAEITVLKNNLTIETNARKKQENHRSSIEADLAQARRQISEVKHHFDHRLKEEQRQAQESVTKEESETRFYRNALEKAREEFSKKEMEYSREVNELQGRLARKEVKIERLEAQLKNQEGELTRTRQEITAAQRDLTKINSQMLININKNKRFELKVKELNEEIQRAGQRLHAQTSEALKRESLLRAHLKEKMDQLVVAESKVNSLEKRLISADDEIRRLAARI